MKSYAKTILLKDDPQIIAQYRQHHDEIWPEVVKSFREVGVLDIRIWLIGRRLFMLMDVADDFEPAYDFDRYLKLNPRNKVWEDLMTSYQERAPEAKPDEHWAEMEPVFKMSDHLK